MRTTLITRRNWRRRILPFVVATAAMATAIQVTANAVDGNITPSAIEIDTGNNANLYPSPATGCSGNSFNQTPTAVDWVADCLANNDLTIGTNAAAQKGHWSGFRVLDGIAGADQDIFLTGGKENQLDTWNPGPGSVGSSKYDITQAYIANNTEKAFFGMERRGNNGTTAFDWEFNQLAPPGNAPNYIPTRSECDVLVTFEMQGSGKSGSADPFLFRYDDPDVSGFSCASPPSTPSGDSDRDGSYKPVSATGIVTSINNSPTPSAPWGAVDSQGNWTTDPIDRFQFAEASVPLSLLGISPGDTCTAISRFVQVRTRASSVDTADLKDLTKIFSFDFFAPTNPTQTLSENCDAKFDFDSSIESPNPAPNWKFTIDDPTQVTLAAAAGQSFSLVDDGVVNGKQTWHVNGQYNGEVQVTFPDGQDQVTIGVSQAADNGSGCNTGSSGSIIVHRGLGITASLTPQCGNVFNYDATATGGTGTKSFSWKFEKLVSSGPDVWQQVATSTSEDGSIDMDDVTGGGAGTYRGIVTVTDQANVATDKPACSKTVTTNSVTVYDALAGSAQATPACDGTFDWQASVSGGKAPYDISVKIQRLVSNVWVDEDTVTANGDADGAVSGTYNATGEPGRYRLSVHASDSQSVGATGVPCTADFTSSEFEMRDQLTASASKDAANTNGSTLTVAMDGSHSGDLAGDNVTYQWQVRVDGGAYTNLSGKTTEDIGYSTFKTDETTPDAVTFSIASGAASGSYKGRVWAADLRLHVTRTVGGLECTANSDPVTVKLVEAVDP